MSEKHRWHIRFVGQIIEVRGWPDRPFTATKVYTENYTKWAINAKGQMFCSLIDHDRVTSAEGRALKVLIGLATLGAVDRKAVAEIRKREKAANDKCNRGYHAREMACEADRAGITLTKSQQALIATLDRASQKPRQAIG